MFHNIIKIICHAVPKICVKYSIHYLRPLVMVTSHGMDVTDQSLVKSGKIMYTTSDKLQVITVLFRSFHIKLQVFDNITCMVGRRRTCLL